MRLRHKKNAENDVLNNPFCINISKDNNNLVSNNYLDLKEIFKNENPICLELGMGKGQFVIEMSKKYEDFNFIGVEKSATIVLKAIDKLSSLNEDINYTSLSSAYPNLRFMCENIENLKYVFSPHSIYKIFLNFSDPWPKKRHENRRLTHHNFLSLYEELLQKDSILEFKTDNKLLFDYSLEEINNSNFKLLQYTYDLHNDSTMNKDNIMTEYEYKFSSLGNKICKLIAKI